MLIVHFFLVGIFQVFPPYWTYVTCLSKVSFDCSLSKSVAHINHRMNNYKKPYDRVWGVYCVTCRSRAVHSRHLPRRPSLQKALGQRCQAARVKSQVRSTGRATPRAHSLCLACTSFTQSRRSQRVSRLGSSMLSTNSWRKIHFSLEVSDTILK